MFLNSYFTRTISVLCLFAAPAHAELLYGLDASAESSAAANDASFNVFSGTGVGISSPETVTGWITTTATGGQNIVPNFNNATATVTLNGPSQTYGVVVTCRVDLSGTHDVTFDRFAFSAQRAGAGDSNVVSDASFSIDGENFTSVLVEEVAVGANNGTNDVGPVDTITDFREPNGLGGTIGPQQTYVISGLEAAGAISSGSFYVRFTIGESSQTPGSITILNDRGDLSTTAMNLAAANTSDLGADDGFDMAWFGTSEPVFIPTQWVGAVSGDWSDIGNWVDQIPSDTAGPAVFSTLSGDNLDTSLNQPLTVPSLIVIEPSGPVSIEGSGPLTLSSGIIDTLLATQELTISTPLVIDLDSIWTIGSFRTEIDAVISGAGGFTKRGTDSLLELRANNTYSGFTVLENISGSGFDGVIRIFDPGALGDLTNGTSVDAGASLELGAILASPVLEPLFLSGNGGSGNPGSLSNGSASGDNTWAGPITLSNNARIRNNAAGTTFTIDTPIDGTDVILTIDGSGETLFTGAFTFGTGGILKVGSGTATISNGNDFSGNTTVNAGTLILNGAALPDGSTLEINNGLVQVTGTERVAALILDSVAQAEGTWGASGSGAENIDDVHFSGADGVVLVESVPVVEESIVVTSATGGEGNFALEWMFSGGAVDIFRSPDLVTWVVIETDNNTGAFTDLTAPAGRAFYVLVPTGEIFPSAE